MIANDCAARKYTNKSIDIPRLLIDVEDYCTGELGAEVVCSHPAKDRWVFTLGESTIELEGQSNDLLVTAHFVKNRQELAKDLGVAGLLGAGVTTAGVMVTGATTVLGLAVFGPIIFVAGCAVAGKAMGIATQRKAIQETIASRIDGMISSQALGRMNQ